MSEKRPDSMPDVIVFDIRQLTKIYRMGEVEVQALRDVTLTLPEAELVVLLGPSGSGKSTLLNIIGGLDVPTSGQVLYRGTDLTRADEADLTAYRRRHVGFVFQFYNLIPSLTALENVALVTEISSEPMAPEEALRLVNLDARRDHFPAQLSGGEQQRSPSPERSPSGRRSCCVTSRRARSTSPPAWWSSRRSPA
jgi:putative ABC transport system ATP-binding protein